MRALTLTLLVVAVAGCEGGLATEGAAKQAELSTGRALGEACVAAADCGEGLRCQAARGDSVCLPASWFSGTPGAWCYRDADCIRGLRCDTEASPHPIVDGACRASSAQ
jgi:hypothetical protein